MLIPAFNQRTMQAPSLAPLPATITDPTARSAAIAQLSHLPWGHPHAVELRRLFRLAGEGRE
jgi:hypothetical protein